MVIRTLTTAVVAAALAALALAQGTPPPAQPPPSGQAQRPTFRAEANFVRVDVYATAGGRPVTDLRQEEFEILEDGAPQVVRSFEHVSVRAAADTAARAEPNTVSQSREMATDPRSRLFVLFIDSYHISLEGAASVRRALVRLLDRMLGPDDMVAVMTPEMPARAVAFARRAGPIEEVLDRFWTWGRRDRASELDPIERQYQQCYPGGGFGGSEIAQEMIARRREKAALDAVEDLIAHLGGLREERKAVLTITEGWALYRPNQNLARMIGNRVPGLDGPVRTGQGGVDYSGQSLARCDQDRLQLAQVDSFRRFHDLLDQANRANVSFYPVDPRGLPVFDTSIGSGQALLPAVDAAVLSSRLDTLRTLANATDGLAILNSNDIDAGLRRVSDDLSSYYLLGYYSTNTALDGRYRAIRVRVKRPGVEVRARRGYRAATKGEAAARAAAEAVPVDASRAPLTAALAPLGRIRADAALRAQAGYTWRVDAGAAARPVLWLAVELDAYAVSRDERWQAGAEVTVSVTGPDQSRLDVGRHVLTREARALLLHVPQEGAAAPGEHAVRVSAKPVGYSLGLTETLRVTVPPAPDSAAGLVVGQPLLFRRGPFAGAGWQAVGDPRFRRQERIKVEVAAAGGDTSGGVRLLDRAGNPRTLPVTAVEREEHGTRVIGGEVTLAPLGLGDYILEITVVSGTTTTKTLVAFRIVP